MYQHLDHHEFVRGIYLDLQKAFDTVDHKILLTKLSNYGIRGSIHSFAIIYPIENNMYVFLVLILTLIKYRGVPPGSVLGPLLSLLYINDIGHSISC